MQQPYYIIAENWDCNFTMWKHIFITFLLLFLVLNNTNAQLVSSYENGAEKIDFYKDSTFVISIRPFDLCQFSGWQAEDTICFGKYLCKNNKFLLFTPPEYHYSSLNAELITDSVTQSIDSLTLILNSPFEREREKNKGVLAYEEAYFYMVEAVYRINGHRKDTLWGPFFSKNIVIPYEKKDIISINVRIYPHNHSRRLSPYFAFLRVCIYMKDLNSNYLVFEIPKFSTMYMFWRRYNGCMVEKIGKNLIRFDVSGSLLFRNPSKGSLRKIPKKCMIMSPYENVEL